MALTDSWTRGCSYSKHTTAPINHIRPIHPVSIHQMAPPRGRQQTSDYCLLLPIYRPRKDERLSWPDWLTCSGRFTNINGHQSAAGRAQDSESTPAKDPRSTTGPRNQIGRHTKKCSFLCEHLHPHVIHVPWTYMTHHSKLQTAAQSVQPFTRSSQQRVPVLYSVH